MTIAEHTTLPIFQADQVLTSDHLNDLVNYLEEQERLTRAKLIGTGIACGLEIRVIGDEIAICTGVGVSSTGLLLAFAGEENGETRYGFHRPLSEDTKKAYSFFRKGEATRDIFELLPQKLEGAEALPADLSDFGVLLYLECFDRKLKNCVQNDCNEKGFEREYRLRLLLVSLADLREIICEEEDLNVPKSEADIAARFYGTFQMGPMQLLRFRPGSLNLTSYQDFFDYYQSLISNSLPEMMTTLKQSYQLLEPVLSASYGSGAAFFNAINQLAIRFDQIRVGQPILLQYFHAFLCDLIEAYHEYRACAIQLMSACCPPLLRFPKHLRLGQLVGPEGCGPSAYRTVFQHAELYNQRGLRKKVVMLHRRMYSLMLRFIDPRGFDEIRITPSVGLDRPLSLKSIPYYYQVDDNLLQRWNPHASHHCQSDEQLSYHADSFAPENPFAVNPLQYQLRPYDFYRIEGHLGKVYTNALEDILDTRNKNNLAFDVVALKLGSSADSTSIEEMRCSFQDLEVICNAWKEDLACRLRNVAQNFGQVNVAGSLKANQTSSSFNTISSRGGLTDNSDNSSEKSRFSSFTTIDLSQNRFNQGQFTLASNQSTSYIKVASMVKASIPVSQQDDLLGNYIAAGIEKAPSDLNADAAAAIALEDLRKRDDVSQLKNVDFQVAYEYPVKIVTSAVEFARRAEVSCDDIDIEALEQTQARLILLFQQYALLLLQYESDNEQFEVLVNAAATIQLTNLFLSYCSLEKLKILIAEMDRRKNELRQLNLFHNYLRKHPGMDHAGGVPKGGTFVLVYHEEDRPSTDDPNRTIVISGQVVDQQGVTIPGATVVAVGTTIGTITDFDGRFTITVPAATKYLDVYSLGQGRRRILVTGPVSNLGVLLDGTDAVFQDDRPIPGTRTIVADFFLPYNCCSDCPPIDYVLLPSDLPSAVSLSIERNLFCVPTELTEMPFTVEPADATVTGEGVTQNDAGQWVFNPNAVDLGALDIKQVTFQVNDQPVPLVITVERSPVADCEFRVEWRTIEGQTTLVAILVNQASNNAEVFTWRIVQVNEAGEEVLNLYKEETESRNTLEIPLGVKPGDLLQVEFYVRSANCDDLKTGEIITVPEPTVDFNFRVVTADGLPMDPTQIPNTFQGDLFLIIQPGEGILEPPPVMDKLGLDIIKETPSENTYVFQSLDKAPIDYPLIYHKPPEAPNPFVLTVVEKTDGFQTGSTDLQANLNTTRNLIATLSENNVFKKNVGSEAVAVSDSKNIYDEMAVLAKTSGGRKKMTADEFIESYTAKIKTATSDTNKRLIAANKKNDEDIQKTLVPQLRGLYQAQVVQTLVFIESLGQDLAKTHALSKLLTTFTNQIKNLSSKDVIVDTDGSFMTELKNIRERFGDKAKLVEKMDKMIETLG